jgi:hypothetical protein
MNCDNPDVRNQGLSQIAGASHQKIVSRNKKITDAEAQLTGILCECEWPLFGPTYLEASTSYRGLTPALSRGLYPHAPADGPRASLKSSQIIRLRS